MNSSKKKGIGYVILIFLLVIFLTPGLVMLFQQTPAPTEGGVEGIELDTESICFPESKQN